MPLELFFLIIFVVFLELDGKITGYKKKGVRFMKINSFAQKVCEVEGKKIQVNVAQVKEILRAINNLLGGELYKIIRKR